jgi:hypothetical protein
MEMKEEKGGEDIIFHERDDLTLMINIIWE